MSWGSRWSVTLAGAGALLGLSAGCLITNTQHCGYPAGDNPCDPGFVCSKCAVDNNGCVPAAQAEAIDQNCLASTIGTTDATLETSTSEPTTDPTVGPTTLDPTTETTTTVDPSTTDETTFTTDPPICDPSENLADPDCADPGAPYCVAPGACGPCTELPTAGKQCSDVDVDKTACEPNSGLCVECTEQDVSGCDDPAKPACEPEDFVCVACSEHWQCPSGACDLSDNTCFPEESKVIYVQNTLDVCGNGNGSEEAPYCTFAAAVGDLSPGDPTIIRVRDGQSDLMLPLSLEDEGYKLAIIGVDTPGALLDGQSNIDPMITVPPGSFVFIANLRFKNPGGSTMMSCANGNLFLDDVRIESNGVKPATAVSTSACQLQMRRNIVYRNFAGVQMSGGKLRVENSFFAENGTGGSPFSVINLLGIAEAELYYTTIVDNEPTKPVFQCSGDGVYNVYNSAVLAWNQPADCQPTLFTSVVNLVETVDEENTARGAMFAKGVDGRYDPKIGGMLKDQAMWGQGMPKKDYYLTLRPTLKPGYAGAAEGE